jgi:uncharacterized protein (DUF2147 family)
MMRRLLSLALLAGLLLVPTSAHAASTPWSGFTIASNGLADGDFMGARLTDGKPTYRIDPDKSPRTTAYGDLHLASSADRKHQRAAWILSKFGARHAARQAAAVDLATYALLAGVGVHSTRASARLKPIPDATAHRIRTLAASLLAKSKLRAGPYFLTVTPIPGNVGGHLRIRAAVATAGGRPVAGLPVVVALKGQAAAFKTSAKGEVTARFPATSVGWQTATVTVTKVPESRLAIRKPARKGASRIVVAGRKTSLVQKTRVAVRAVPKVTVHDQTAADASKPVHATYDVSGSKGSAARTATVSVYGPFADVESADCTGTAVATKSGTIHGDNSYSTPGVRVTTHGVYAFKVTVAANDLNAKVSACGGALRVRTTPKVRVVADGSRAQLIVAGLADGYDDTATLRLFGPYKTKAAVGCGGAKVFDKVTIHVTKDGTYTSKAIKPQKQGVYAWRAALPAGFLTLRKVSTCGAKHSFVTVG